MVVALAQLNLRGDKHLLWWNNVIHALVRLLLQLLYGLLLSWPLPPDKWSTDYPLSGIYPSRFAAIIRYPSPRKDVYSFPERLRARVLSTRNVI